MLTRDEDERQQVMTHVQQITAQHQTTLEANATLEANDGEDASGVSNDSHSGDNALPPEHFKRQLIAFPQTIHGLVAQLEQLEAWRHIEANTPELASDRVARKELAANVQAAQRQLDLTAGSMLGVRGQRFDPAASDWLHAGTPIAFDSALAFQRYVSRTCDALFHAAPPLKNELLNREKHSSNAKAALNKLVKALLNHPEQHRFGISGTPPEVSMYEAFFTESGSHTPQGDKHHYRLQAPSHPDWQAIWLEIQTFLQASEQQRLPVSDLYARLQQPPFGMRAGTLPLFLYLALLEQPDRVALYRDGLVSTCLE